MLALKNCLIDTLLPLASLKTFRLDLSLKNLKLTL